MLLILSEISEEYVAPFYMVKWQCDPRLEVI